MSFQLLRIFEMTWKAKSKHKNLLPDSCKVKDDWFQWLKPHCSQLYHQSWWRCIIFIGIMCNFSGRSSKMSRKTLKHKIKQNIFYTSYKKNYHKQMSSNHVLYLFAKSMIYTGNNKKCAKNAYGSHDINERLIHHTIHF